MSLRIRSISAMTALGVAFGFASLAGAQVKLSYEDLLNHLTNLDRLPVIEPGVYCRQFSSYDRASKYDEATGQYINWDANGDAGQYIRIDPQTHEGVMAEMDGPGCIFRIWSANPQGVIRFYLDGDVKPTYEWDFHKLFTGAIDPFIEPLVWKRDKTNPNSASDCYLPIPFAKSCKITSVVIDKDGKTHIPGHYYAIDYRVFPKDWQVETFKLPLTAGQEAAVKKTAAQWAGARPEDYMVTSKTVPPGETAVLQELNGPATIKEFRLKLKSAEKWAARKVLLKVWWDRETKPSVDCPINDFFGEPRDVAYRSYPMLIAKDMNTCYFPMPFRRSAKIAVVNEGNQPADISSSFSYMEGEVPENRAYFHAKYRQEKEGTTFDYPLVEATGEGKLVGICLYPDNIHGGWWGEGDEKVYVDGEKFPSWFGTGSEDFFGDAWGIAHFVNPSHGHPMKQIERMQGCYRWFLGDNIPFYKSFKMTIENYAAREPVKNDYYSVAYWYQLPGGKDFFKDVPVADRVPRGFVAQDGIEAEKSLPKAAISGMEVVDDTKLPRELSRGRGVKLTGKVGDTFLFNLVAPSHDRFILEAVPARDVKASTFEVLAGGTQPMGKYIELEKGDNVVGIRFTGQPVDGDRCELIVDYFQLDVYRNMITDWVWIGPFPNPGGKGLDTPFPPETETAWDRQYAGRDGQVGWKPIHRRNGLFSLNKLIEPKEYCVFYAAVVVHAPRAGKQELLTGSDDGLKVWINGKAVFENPIMRGLRADDDRFAVDLKEGDNLLLMKVQQDGGDVGFAARFLDPKGELTYSLPK
jgi:hypothetical protein